MPTEVAGRLMALRPPPCRPAAENARTGATAPPERAEQEKLRSALLDARRLELLILNQHESLHVHSRAQFFVWTQGMLQSLMPHRLLICALRSGAPMAFRAEAFSTAVPAAGVFGGLLLRDATVMPYLIKSWKQQQFRPFTCGTGEPGGLTGGSLARELARIGVTQLQVHGSHDAEGGVCGLYVLADAAESPVPDQSYLMQLCIPFLHAAWVRSSLTVRAGEGARAAPVSAGVLTPREREVLRWIYLGKSNGEIGAILRISPMTVKNHVQKILRKLDVVNRTQAVGKALDAQIISA